MTAGSEPVFSGLAQCASCFQVDQWKLRRLGQGTGCPLIAQAAAGELPPQWNCGRCRDYLKRPPVYRRPRAKPIGVQGTMFDEPEPTERVLVEVPGWPDYYALGLVPKRTRNNTPPGAA